MGLLDSITRWFKSEAADVKSSVDDLEQRLDADLSRKERELNATPSERLEMIQDEIGESDAFSAVQDKIDAAQGKALADADVADLANPSPSAAESSDPAPEHDAD